MHMAVLVEAGDERETRGSAPAGGMPWRVGIERPDAAGVADQSGGGLIRR